MDLKTRSVVDTFTYNVVDPVTGDNVEGMTVNLRPTYSAEWKREDAKLVRQMRAKGRNYKPTPDDMMQTRVKLASSVIASWTGFEEDGKKLQCVPSTVERVLAEYPWLLNQIDIALGDESNFLTKGSQDSESA